MMLRSVRIRNFKCLRDITVPLGRLNVLIGPNAIGKSTVLQAIAVGGNLAFNSPLGDLLPPHQQPRDWLTKAVALPAALEVEFCIGAFEAERVTGPLSFSARINVDSDSADIPTAALGERIENLRSAAMLRTGDDVITLETIDSLPSQIVETIRGLRVFRFHPREISRPAHIADNATPVLDGSGFGVASVLRYLSGVDRPSLEKIENVIRETFFEELDRINTPELRSGNDTLTRYEFVTGAGQTIPAEELSDGVLLVLGLLVLRYGPVPQKILLLEEPENGVHPRALEFIMQHLRAMCDPSNNGPFEQILVTTHSPYLPDYAEPDEVIVFGREESGNIRAARLADLPEIETRTKYFNLGEFIHMEGEQKIVREARQHASAGGG